MEKKQDYRFKIIYVIAIMFIVASHTKGGGLSIFTNWFSPIITGLSLFMFSSGYFYKDENENCSCKYIAKKFKRLIVPVYLWNIFYAILVKLSSYKGFAIGGEISLKKLLITPITSGHQFIYNLGRMVCNTTFYDTSI